VLVVAQTSCSNPQECFNAETTAGGLLMPLN
jgi:hypothetical protein